MSGLRETLASRVLSVQLTLKHARAFTLDSSWSWPPAAHCSQSLNSLSSGRESTAALKTIALNLVGNTQNSRKLAAVTAVERQNTHTHTFRLRKTLHLKWMWWCKVKGVVEKRCEQRPSWKPQRQVQAQIGAVTHINTCAVERGRSAGDLQNHKTRLTGFKKRETFVSLPLLIVYDHLKFSVSERVEKSTDC